MAADQPGLVELMDVVSVVGPGHRPHCVVGVLAAGVGVHDEVKRVRMLPPPLDRIHVLRSRDVERVVSHVEEASRILHQLLCSPSPREVANDILLGRWIHVCVHTLLHRCVVVLDELACVGHAACIGYALGMSAMGQACVGNALHASGMRQACVRHASGMCQACVRHASGMRGHALSVCMLFVDCSADTNTASFTVDPDNLSLIYPHQYAVTIFRTDMHR